MERNNNIEGCRISEISSQLSDGPLAGKDIFQSGEFQIVSGKQIISDGKIRYGNASGSVLGLLLVAELSRYALAMNYVRKTFTVEELKQFDRNNGILFHVDENGEIYHEVVSGKKRPDLTCVMYEGGIHTEKCRPYIEDSSLFNFGAEEIEEEQDDELFSLIEEAESGDIYSMEMLMNYYIEGSYKYDINPDQEKACYWMEKLAQAGESIGSFNLATHYAKGCGVERDLEKAVYWMVKAKEQGDYDAQTMAPLYKNALENLKKASSGDAQAMADYSEFMTKMSSGLDGYNQDEDLEEAFQWAQKSANLGNIDGMSLLALAYDHGRGTEENPQKAYELMKQASELGHPKSQWNLALAYLNGRGTMQNTGKGIEWAEKSAEHNDFAIAGLGHIYFEGLGVEPDFAKAAQWYEKALEKTPNDSGLTMRMGMACMGQTAYVDAESLNKSLYWYKKSADLGNKKAHQMYVMWSFAGKKNGGVIPEEFTVRGFMQDLQIKAQNGDEEAIAFFNDFNS